MSMQGDEQSELLYDDQGNAILNPRIREHQRALERDKAALEKEVALLRVGSLMDRLGVGTTGAGKFFREHYAGPADEESVKAAAQDAGALTGNTGGGDTGGSTASDQEIQQRQDELDRLRRANNATNGTSSSDSLGELEEIKAKMRKAVAEGNEAEFDALMESAELLRLSQQPINFN